MAIPKKIHWCWLSGDPLPKIIQDCVNSWKRIMPDYEFVLWDMNRFNIHSVKYVEDACAARKWAFASDYIRLLALYTEGGVYLDADVIVYRRFDDLLNCSAFSGIIKYPMDIRLSDNNILKMKWYLEAEMIGAEKNHPFIKACLDYFDMKAEFRINEDGSDAFEFIPEILTNIAFRQFQLNPSAPTTKMQILDKGIIIYPPTVLGCTWSAVNMKTYAAHFCMVGWGKKTQKLSLKRLYERLCLKYRLIAMLHIFRKKIFQ